MYALGSWHEPVPLVRERAHPQAMTSMCQEVMAITACELQLPKKQTASPCHGKFTLSDKFLLKNL